MRRAELRRVLERPCRASVAGHTDDLDEVAGRVADHRRRKGLDNVRRGESRRWRRRQRRWRAQCRAHRRNARVHGAVGPIHTGIA
jgi:hypothetical protein